MGASTTAERLRERNNRDFVTHGEPTLKKEELRKTNAYWRAANCLSVGQIYLYDNPLLREPLTLAHVKPLYAQGVVLEGIILKPNMVLPGLSCPEQESVEQVAAATVASLIRVVPAAFAGIAFLSGGQSAEFASARLNAMNVIAGKDAARLPWPLAFSFARAIQQPALETWREQQANVVQAQQAIAHRALCNRAALQGDYSAAMERA